MKDVKVGDRVLTMTRGGSPIFSEVTMMMHRNPGALVNDYVSIKTSKEKAITLSRYHMVYTKESEYIFAKDVHENQTLVVYDQLKNKFEDSLVTKVSLGSDIGVYAPLTNEGTIVVDDVFASCYALFPSHHISHAVFLVWRNLLYPFSSHEKLENENEYHWYPDLFRRSMNYLHVFNYLL